MKFILGTKDRMTQVFDAQGVVHPATILRVTPLTVTQVKTEETDGYEAVQVATGAQKPERVAKANRTKGSFKHVKEFRPNVHNNETIAGLTKGTVIPASVFAPGDTVAVSAVSKGKGFQGVVKRHGFSGGPRSHGNKDIERAPGSIGAGGMQRVFKGVRMAGRMGSDRITVKNLTILQVNEAENLILISGAIPGRKGTLVEVRGI
jgi:large subunit ribosomal protein L3